jgi:hypothetical protein
LILGDGIGDSQVSSDGSIWVAYSLTGTTGNFGELGWGRISPEEWVDPIGHTGLVRFDTNGKRAAEYEPPSGLLLMNDCFALNASEGAAWCCYHPDFPIVRVSSTGVADGWSTDLVSVEALAMDDETVIAYSRINDMDELRVYRLRNDGTAIGSLFEPALPGSAPLKMRWVGGRGAELHLATETAWYAISVASLAQ